MVILGIGSNENYPLSQLRAALNHIKNIPGLIVEKISPVYQSDAMLPDGAPENWNRKFLNAAIGCTTTLFPEELLIECQNIELAMGRKKDHELWSPRIIDIDILALDDLCAQSEIITIPHPGLLKRPFALWPLADIDPFWVHPVEKKHACDLVLPFGSRFDGEALFKTHQISHRLVPPYMAGILNLTPDSFSDGGKYSTTKDAEQQIELLFKTGAEIIDIGSESTRPRKVSRITLPQPEELERLMHVLENLEKIRKNRLFKPVFSIDSRYSETVKVALSYGVDWINDVTGFTDDEMCRVAAESDAKLILMHNLGIPPCRKRIIDLNIDPVNFIILWAEKQIKKLNSFGINRSRIIFDPGIGFGVSAEQSFKILNRVNEFSKLNLPILIGHSRKSFQSIITAEPFCNRDIETAAISCFLSDKKVDYLRVHDVNANLRAINAYEKTILK